MDDNTADNTSKNSHLCPPWQKGQSGNPAGRPKGSISITARIKEELEKVPDGEKKSLLEQLVERILQKAIKKGDERTIRTIWAYIDGQPMQQSRVDLESEGGIIFNIMPANGEKKDET